MVRVSRVVPLGDLYEVIYEDNIRAIAFPTGSDIFIMEPNAHLGKKLMRYGDTFAVIFSDGSRSLAYPTPVNDFYISGPNDGIPIPDENDFIWPFDPDGIDSEWGYRPPPLPGLSDFHSGCDWSLGGGTNIPCAGNGTVYMVRHEGNGDSPGRASWGNRIIINHGIVEGKQLFTAYAHMQSSGFPMVSQGDSVVSGQTIGKVGQTGSATGDHLHFVTFIGGLAIGNNSNPLNCKNPRTFMATYNPSGVIA
jgi:murein DD-endopeptidase MepM/ murein hydrolase activator NlpD